MRSNNLKKVSNWEYTVQDASITSQLFDPFYEKLAEKIPKSIAPNILTMVGFFSTMLSYLIVENLYEPFPKLSSLFFFICIVCYMIFDALDGKHARRIGNSSPLGELLDHGCDSVGLIFIILGMTKIFAVDNITNQFLILSIVTLLFINSHIKALRDKVVKFDRFNGPGEALTMALLFVLVRILFDLTLTSINNFLVYPLIVATIVFHIFILKENLSYDKSYEILKIIVPIFWLNSYFGLKVLLGVATRDDLIAFGLLMSVLTGEIIFSKMAIKNTSLLLSILVTTFMLNNVLSFILCPVYFLLTFKTLLSQLGIPMFSVYYNVFCNGVFDLCHIGHHNLFKKALKTVPKGKLIVGIHSDVDVESYKRKPFICEKDRYKIVKNNKLVNKVVENCPLFINEDFIKTHNIHIVVCSPEYDKPDDKYYEVPRRLGILKVLPRTEGISTSDLIVRIKNST